MYAYTSSSAAPRPPPQVPYPFIGRSEALLQRRVRVVLLQDVARPRSRLRHGLHPSYGCRDYIRRVRGGGGDAGAGQNRAAAMPPLGWMVKVPCQLQDIGVPTETTDTMCCRGTTAGVWCQSCLC